VRCDRKALSLLLLLFFQEEKGKEESFFERTLASLLATGLAFAVFTQKASPVPAGVAQSLF
jgi:hypothetical protein